MSYQNTDLWNDLVKEIEVKGVFLVFAGRYLRSSMMVVERNDIRSGCCLEGDRGRGQLVGERRFIDIRKINCDEKDVLETRRFDQI